MISEKCIGVIKRSRRFRTAKQVREGTIPVAAEVDGVWLAIDHDGYFERVNEGGMVTNLEGRYLPSANRR